MSVPKNPYRCNNCVHCGGIVSHNLWCIMRNETVKYAMDAVKNAAVLTEQDKLILHACGALWEDEILPNFATSVGIVEQEQTTNLDA